MEMLKFQNNKCSICGVDFSILKNKDIHIDHKRGIKIARGILCHKCNLGLGLFCENTKFLFRAAEYLEPQLNKVSDK